MRYGAPPQISKKVNLPIAYDLAAYIILPTTRKQHTAVKKSQSSCRSSLTTACFSLTTTSPKQSSSRSLRSSRTRMGNKDLRSAKHMRIFFYPARTCLKTLSLLRQWIFDCDSEFLLNVFPIRFVVHSIASS